MDSTQNPASRLAQFVQDIYDFYDNISHYINLIIAIFKFIYREMRARPIRCAQRVSHEILDV